MFLGKRRRRRSREELRTSDRFLRNCLRLILCWAGIMVLMIGFVVVLHAKGKSSASWAEALFTVSCALDFLATAKIIPMTLQMLRDPNYKEPQVRRSIWKLRGLILMNFLFSAGCIIWIWTAKDATTTDTIVKWLLFACLLIGLMAIKSFFTVVYVRLKRFMSKLFVDFHVIPPGEAGPTVTSIATPEPLPEAEDSEGVKLLEG